MVFQGSWLVTTGKLHVPVLLCGVLACGSLRAQGKKADDAKPSFEELLKLNQGELFDPSISLWKDQLTVSVPNRGFFDDAFDLKEQRLTRIFSDVREIKDGGLQRLIGTEGDTAFVAKGGGAASSKFELANDFRLTFRLRVHSVPPNAAFVLRLVQDEKNFIEISSFREITVVEKGRKTTRTTADKRFTRHISSWLKVKNDTPVEVVFKDKKLSVFLTSSTLEPGTKDDRGNVRGWNFKTERVEVVSMDGIEKPSGGAIVIAINNWTVVARSFQLTGKVHRPWVQARFDQLEKTGKLRKR
jgi:hypothetical protein